MDKNPILRK